MNDSESGDNLYLILPCDSNLDRNPQNNATKYTVQLEKSLNLNHSYECSLIDVILPESEKYFRDFNYWIVWAPLTFAEQYEEWDFSDHKMLKFTVDCDGIKTTEDLAEKLVKSLPKNYGNLVSFEFINDLKNYGLKEPRKFMFYKYANMNYDRNANIFTITSGLLSHTEKDKALEDGLILFLKFEEELEKILGIKLEDRINVADDLFTDLKGFKRLNNKKNLKTNYVKYNEDFFSKGPASIKVKPDKNTLKDHHYSRRIDFFVKCDFILDSYINSEKQKFLRFCHSDHEGNLIADLNNKIFIPILKSEINNINIELDRIGKRKKFSFLTGCTILIIELKKIHQKMDYFYDDYITQIILNNKNSRPKNGEFEIHFKKTIELKEPMKCALSEIIIPKEAFTNQFGIDRSLELILVFDEEYKKKNVILVENENKSFNCLPFYKKHFKIKSGKYDLNSLSESLKKINQEARSFIFEIFKLRFPKFDENLELNKKLINFPKLLKKDSKFRNRDGNINLQTVKGELVRTAVFYFNLDEDLHQILGFSIQNYPSIKFENNTIIKKNYGYGDLEPNFNKFDNFFIYSDIVTETHLGNIKSNILKILPRNKTSEESQIIYSIKNLLYVPLRINEINSIKISIRDNLGQIIEYNDGEITLTLVFQPIDFDI